MVPLPSPFGQIPRYPLLYPTPSPIHPLPALTRLLTSSPAQPSPRITLYAKREDQACPLASSGNKYRKLEYLIPDILSPAPKYGTLAPGPNHGTLIPPLPPTGTTPPPPARKPTTLVTEGALQSNHTIQVASIANHLSLDSVLLLHQATGGGYQASTNKDLFSTTGNVELAKLLGADIRILDTSIVSKSSPTPTSSPPNPNTENETQDKEKDQVHTIFTTLQTTPNRAPYWIPSGASLHPLGGLGYARCAFEIAEQEKSLPRSLTHHKSPRFDYIFIACGSGSTLGGLIAGMKLLHREEEHHHHHHHQPHPHPLPPRKIIGIITSPTLPRAHHEARILNFARQAATLIGLDPEHVITEEDICLDERFAGTAYGELDEATRDMLGEMAREEAVVLDPVYTGKVVRGMRHWVREGEVAKDWVARGGEPGGEVNVLFVHTGGQAALSAYADVM
ncbi:1-aminocyclopropane-1-carboxylate deaminase/D-cysteine desulfhydrase [Aspergillus ibericus CBS 121593]|uniref:Tryptophan synthase beta subunit-like PLP-dependent enzyme n=1 Tax=Aspergillus ibericus CBS 121593 TaxID=1448316 RepID=A0A395H217_9EURO|nr:tryptophan synthase beta subunit-like PLP-dependent enzyme [Aspergillus ibericus CBS 121593]RAL01941.1 tryptophan synthase beta subunit-like PLP-dependent enzyme [Aspergillus ibericus CBS 121593]